MVPKFIPQKHVFWGLVEVRRPLVPLRELFWGDFGGGPTAINATTAQGSETEDSPSVDWSILEKAVDRIILEPANAQKAP